MTHKESKMITGDDAAKAQAAFAPMAAHECCEGLPPCPLPVIDGYEDVGTSAQLPTKPEARKSMPICTGVLDYFPLAIAAVAECSKVGNDQHNPNQPLHWAREKSSDHADCIVRHLIERGTVDADGIRHAAKAAWRALALLQLEIEAGNAREGRA
jgi:hypothetical protein